MQELRGNIRVFCRARPLLPFELNNGETSIVNYSALENDAATRSHITIQHKTKPYEFEFDCVFDEHSTQSSIYDQLNYLITSCLDGYNTCIFGRYLLRGLRDTSLTRVNV